MKIQRVSIIRELSKYHKLNFASYPKHQIYKPKSQILFMPKQKTRRKVRARNPRAARRDRKERRFLYK